MTQVNQLNISRTLLDSTIRDAVNQRVDQYQRLNDSLRQVNPEYFLKLKYFLCFFHSQIIVVPDGAVVMVRRKTFNDKNRLPAITEHPRNELTY